VGRGTLVAMHSSVVSLAQIGKHDVAAAAELNGFHRRDCLASFTDYTFVHLVNGFHHDQPQLRAMVRK
jgi:hypothetical protein